MAVQPQWQAQSTTRHLIPALENKEQRAIFPPHTWEETPQVLPGSTLGSSGSQRCMQRGFWPLGWAEGHRAAGAFLTRALCEPVSVAEGDFPAREDTPSPLSNCSLAQGSRLPEQELAPSPLLHCLFPQPGSRGAPLFLSGSQPGSASPAPSHPLRLSVTSLPFPLLFTQIFLGFWPHHSVLLHKSPTNGGAAPRRHEGVLPSAEAWLHPPSPCHLCCWAAELLTVPAWRG